MKKSLLLIFLIFFFSGCSQNKFPDQEKESEMIYFISQIENVRTINSLKTINKEVSIIKVKSAPEEMVISLPIWCKNANLFFATFSNNKNSDIYSFNSKGEKLKNLTNTSNNYESNPVCSPDGKWIVFEKFDSKSDIWLMDINGKKMKNLTEEYPQNITPVWSNDSSLIFFNSLKNGSPNIFSITLDGKLTNISKGIGIDGSFSLSPDSSKIVFDSDRAGNFDIFLLDLNSGDLRNITFSNDIESEPLFSSDGRKVLYKIQSGPNFDYVVFHLESGTSDRITSFPEKYKGNAIWSSDSTKIYFNMEERGSLDIFSCDINSNELINLTNTPKIDEFSPLLVNFLIK